MFCPRYAWRVQTGTQPPLSWRLRDSPRAAYSFGGAAHRPRTFQRVHPPAVRVPESFRGGCSFGGGKTEVFAALSRGVRLCGRNGGDSASAPSVAAETGRGARLSQSPQVTI